MLRFVKNKIVKVCGITDVTQANELSKLGVNWLGFIFYEKSKRYAFSKLKYENLMLENAKRVGVFVNETIENITKFVVLYKLEIVQLHGNESPEFCTQLKDNLQIEIIKAIPVKNNLIENFEYFYTAVNYLLFDTSTNEFGGTGIAFDYLELNRLEIKLPFLIAGGIDNKIAKDIFKNVTHPNFLGIDINSKFETSPGIKNINQIELLKKQLYINDTI